ncbi:MAG: hypothetical protein LLG04_14015 [Parachlamydia sp.]|nr:hypothetical protein [Parachlamydia sp.]
MNGIKWEDVRSKLSQSAAWSMHAFFSGGVGLLAGRTINMCDRFLHPVKSALGKPPLVNPLHGAMCGVTFALIDRAAHLALKRYIPAHAAKPITHSARIVVSITLATIISSAILPVSVSMAAVLLATNVLATTLLVSITDNYTKLVYKGGDEAKKKPAVPAHTSVHNADSLPAKPKPQLIPARA